MDERLEQARKVQQVTGCRNMERLPRWSHCFCVFQLLAALKQPQNGAAPSTGQPSIPPPPTGGMPNMPPGPPQPNPYYPPPPPSAMQPRLPYPGSVPPNPYGSMPPPSTPQPGQPSAATLAGLPPNILALLQQQQQQGAQVPQQQHGAPQYGMPPPQMMPPANGAGQPGYQQLMAYLVSGRIRLHFFPLIAFQTSNLSRRNN